MYNQLFNKTTYTDYKLAKILNVQQIQVQRYRKSKTINLKRLFEFMRLLEVKELESEDKKVKITL